MSDDLVKRLREKAFRTETYELFNSAADRIEKLEASLNRVVDLTNCWESSLISQVNEIARKALEGKDD
jgi:hypothetical protein